MKHNRSALSRCFSLISLLALLSSIASLATTANAATMWTSKASVGTPIGGTNKIVAVDDSEMYAYVAQGSRLVALDIHTEPGNVTGYSYSLPVNGLIMDIALRGDYAYLAAGTAGLVIIDISNPLAMRIVSQLTVGTNATAVTLSGNMAYLASNLNTLFSVDVSNPASPSLHAEFGATAVYDLAIHGSRLYVASGNLDLMSYDIATPGDFLNPVHKTINQGGNFSSISIDPLDSKLVLGGSDGYIAYIDITNPNDPVTIYNGNYLSSVIGIQDIFLAGNRVFTAEADKGICIYTITNPTSWTPSSKQCDTIFGVDVVAVTFLDGILYAGRYNGLQMYRLSDFSKNGGYSFEITQTRRVVAAHDRFYVLDDDKLSIWDAGMTFPQAQYPGTFQKVVPITTASGEKYIALSNFESQLVILNVNNLSGSPVEKIVFLNGSVDDMEILNKTLFMVISQPNPQLLSLDITAPMTPTVRDTVDLPVNFINPRMAVNSYITLPGPTSHQTAYITSSVNGLAVVDISDPANLGAVSHPISQKMYRDVAVLPSAWIGAPVGLYLVNETGIEVYNPSSIGSEPESTIQGAYNTILVKDRLLFLAGNYGVIYYDLSTPLSPKQTGWAKLPRPVLALDDGIDAKQIYATTGAPGTFPVTALDRSTYLPFLRR